MTIHIVNTHGSLPTVLDLAELPEPELLAARLDGEVARLGPGFCPIDLPDTVSERAHALRRVLPARLIADRRTAAWVHGAIPTLPHRLEACVRSDARASTLLLTHASVREVIIDEREVLRFGFVRVTTPLRTILDLVRGTELDVETASVVTALAIHCNISLTSCVAELASRKHLPRKLEAIARLNRLLD